jgi:hypothetical protein
MKTLTELPERCEHSMIYLELIVTKTERAQSFAPVLSTSFAIVHCHKCNTNIKMISDYSDWAPRHDKVEFFPRCRG